MGKHNMKQNLSVVWQQLRNTYYVNSGSMKNQQEKFKRVAVLEGTAAVQIISSNILLRALHMDGDHITLNNNLLWSFENGNK